MCNIFGFDEEVVFNHFQNPKGHIDMKSKVKENNKLIAALAHLLIGGNYWYVNSNGEVPPFMIFPTILHSSEFITLIGVIAPNVSAFVPSTLAVILATLVFASPPLQAINKPLEIYTSGVVT